MKLLLVVGLAAVVIVILIAVFLSVRLGRGDDHEEPVRPGSRDRRHRDGDDARWQDADARDTRRVLVSSRTGGSGRRSQDETDTSHYHDRGQDRPSREQASRGRERDYEYPDRRGTGLSEHPSSPRRAAARNGQPGSGRDYRDRPADGHRDQRGNGQPDYHSGPQRAYAGGDYPSGPLPVPDFAAGDFPSADYPSMDFGSGPLPAADYPSADYPSMDFGSGPLPAADHPSADYPSMDVPSGPLPAADYPSGEYPAAPAGTPRSSRSRSKSGPAKNGSGREQPESRRKPAKSQGPAKGRSRGKRDDDDWPSTEWDKLTDEQYWAELSSDKPLSTSGRATQAASHGTSRSANGGTQAASHLSAAPMPAAEPARELPSRKAPSPSREPATERLPVRARPQPPVPARAGNGSPATGRAEVTLPRPAEEPTLAVLSSLATSAPARPHGTLDEDPLTSPSFARPSLDSRSYHRPETPTSGSGAHLQPAASPASAGYGTPAYSTADYGPAGYGTDSYQPGSYQAGTDYPSLGYPDGDYGASVPADTYHQPRQAGPGYAYPAPQPPAAAPVASWHRPPDERAAVAGNPYGSHVEPAPASYQPSPAGHSNSHPSGGHAYPPGLASSHADPGMSPAASHAADAGHYPMAGLYPQAGYPSDGGYGYEQHPSQAVYPVPQEAASYPPGYAGEYHPADPYDNNGYG
jgi:hypothetical protein